MNSEEFLNEILAPVHEFCRYLDTHPPAYCYAPLRTDEERIRVMKSRLFNELRAADLFGTWLKTTPELDVKATMAESAHEEMVHAQLLMKRIGDLGADPFDYKPLPAQIAMFNAMEGLNETCERIAGLSLAGETVANYLIQMLSQVTRGARVDQATLSAHHRRRRRSRQRAARIPQTLCNHRGSSGSRAPRRGDAHGAVSRISRQLGPLGDGQRSLVGRSCCTSQVNYNFRPRSGAMESISRVSSVRC